jgi:hypothetical protein
MGCHAISIAKIVMESVSVGTFNTAHIFTLPTVKNEPGALHSPDNNTAVASIIAIEPSPYLVDCDRSSFGMKKNPACIFHRGNG